jgi:prepilin-type processing-associated H-X9-DG protein
VLSDATGFTVRLSAALVMLALVAALSATYVTGLVSDARHHAAVVAATCLSNSRQLGRGVLLYAADNDQRFPSSLRDEPPYFHEFILPYASIGAFRCPADRVERTPGWSVKRGKAGPLPSLRYLSYGYNVRLGGWIDPLPSNRVLVRRPVAIPDVVRPGSTLMLAEAPAVGQPGVRSTLWRPYTRNWEGELGDLMATGTIDASQGDVKAPLARHRGRCTTVWVDGHAKSLRIEAFLAVPARQDRAWIQHATSPCFRPDKGCPHSL